MHNWNRLQHKLCGLLVCRETRRSVQLVVLWLPDQVSELQEGNPGSTECRIAWAADAQLEAISPLKAHLGTQLGCVLCLPHGAIRHQLYSVPHSALLRDGHVCKSVAPLLEEVSLF